MGRLYLRGNVPEKTARPTATDYYRLGCVNTLHDSITLLKCDVLRRPCLFLPAKRVRTLL